MLQNFNYDDHIFFLLLKVKLLKDSLRLDLHPSLFPANFTSEISFIAESIIKISDSLKSSPLLVGQLEHGKNLSRLEKQFAGLLTEVLRKETALAASLEESFGPFKKLLHTVNNDLAELKNRLTDTKMKSEEEQYIISEEEYKELFSDEENEA